MNKLLEIALGLVTGIGGFLEAGSLATSAQAGAAFGFQLVWAITLGTICIAFLVEMAGRLAAVSKHTLPDAMRERFGIRFFTVPLIAVVLVSFLVLASEIGGVFHCFSGDAWLAKDALDLGFYLSFSGILTFQNATTLREIAKTVPTDRLLIETDCPYLSPVPHRGKRNEPAYVRHVAELLGALKSDDTALTGTDMGRITSGNARRLFRIP